MHALILTQTLDSSLGYRKSHKRDNYNDSFTLTTFLRPQRECTLHENAFIKTAINLVILMFRPRNIISCLYRDLFKFILSNKIIGKGIFIGEIIF